ncbi:MAG: CBS domain-containing protein [Coriobacteriales bacterium]
MAGSLGTVLLVALAAAGSALAPAGASPTAVAFSGYHLSFCGTAVLFLLFFVVVLLFAKDSARHSAEDRGAGAPSLADAVITDVYSVPETASAYDVAKCLVEHGTSGVPVVDDKGGVVGFVSDGDVMRALTNGTSDKTGMYYLYTVVSEGSLFEDSLRRLRELPVMSIATRQVVSVEVGDSLETASKVLSDTRIKKVPVMEDGRIVGVLSRSVLIRYLVTHVSAT